MLTLMLNMFQQKINKKKEKFNIPKNKWLKNYLDASKAKKI